MIRFYQNADAARTLIETAGSTNAGCGSVEAAETKLFF